eukprot:247386_1
MAEAVSQRDEHNNRVTDNFVIFLDDTFLSPRYLSSFVANDVKYFSLEQFMMAQKAKIMGDDESFKKILNVSGDNDGSVTCKILGRGIKPWDENKWNINKEDVCFHGNYNKFAQNNELKIKLLSYDTKKVFVDGWKGNKIWGVGIDIDDKTIEDKKNWKGQNLLGIVITKVRDQILKEKNEKNEKN